MKRLWILGAVLSLVLAQSCSDNYVGPPSAGNTPSGKLSLSLSFAFVPTGVARVEGTISRQGYDNKTLELAIADTGGTATGSFGDVAVGTWHLKVDALDNGSTVLYTGEKDVEVHSGQATQVTLQLNPATSGPGSIDIVVTWGSGGGTPPSLPSGLVSWWAGDGDATDLGHMNVATLENGVGFGPGKVGQAFTFDGVDDMIEATTNGFPTGNQDRTIELWAKIDSLPVEEAIFAGYGTYGPYYYGTMFEIGTSRGNFFVTGWGLYNTIFGERVELGRWYHVAATVNNGLFSLYVNGILESSDYLELNTPPNATLYIGKLSGDFGAIRRIDGSLDEVSVYNRALTASEILAIYQAGAAGKQKPG